MNDMYCLSGCPVNKRLHDHPPEGSGHLKLLKDHVTLILQGNRIAEISSMSSCRNTYWIVCSQCNHCPSRGKEWWMQPGF